ncbi:aminoglycoside phosphotransferase [Phreatobacter aquaticus]|uniref:Aminoglycoside phosphotransferase n=1 Tax=Phreatobacter aquaticus TaxID=2570229 RepID=A0A4D7QHH9_9HYPH|nr:AAA family ATPase [Phreatobacter aquaticus]QCK84924.1 aminoglycoside phosphotransferase [Phreatobacter aquaticus]
MTRFEAPDVIAFLRRAADPAGAGAEVISTHISHVVIGPATVFKLKRPVSLGYLDFSDPAHRLDLCRTEVALNLRAPGADRIYRRARAITRGADGSLGLDGEGALVDGVVEMAAFDQAQLLDRLAEQGPLDGAMIDRLAATIAAFHNAAEPAAKPHGAARLARVLDINATAFVASGLRDETAAAALDQRFRDRLERHAKALDRRAVAGHVRRCHGDLHLRNICLIDGEPVLFDCLEFDEDLATTDTLYDLAFLLMDLWHRDRRVEANRLMNRYADLSGEADDLALLPFLIAVRAAIRAHVTAAAAASQTATEAETSWNMAETMLRLAEAALQGSEPRLVAVGGLSGSGKSSLARAIAPEIGGAPGARILASDRIRKEKIGAASGPPAEGLYTPEITQAVYHRMRTDARALLDSGVSVIADAVHARPGERAAIAAVATEAGVPFTGLWLDLATSDRASRVEARRNDISDADVAVVEAQAGYDIGPLDWTRLDASGDPETTARAALTRIAT